MIHPEFMKILAADHLDQLGRDARIVRGLPRRRAVDTHGVELRLCRVSIRTWITLWNDNPKPYVWHKTADEILDSLAAYCQRINASGH